MILTYIWCGICCIVVLSIGGSVFYLLLLLTNKIFDMLNMDSPIITAIDQLKEWINRNTVWTDD